MPNHTSIINSPVGKLGIKTENNVIIHVDFLSNSHELKSSNNDITITNALNNYFTKACDFTLPLQYAGTNFQNKVWHALTQIPRGETRTYGELAKQLNTSARAVGNACRRNFISIIIPCHRVVSASGIGGFSGDTAGQKLEIKRWLLTHEGTAV